MKRGLQKAINLLKRRPWGAELEAYRGRDRYRVWKVEDGRIWAKNESQGFISIVVYTPLPNVD